MISPFVDPEGLPYKEWSIVYSKNNISRGCIELLMKHRYEPFIETLLTNLTRLKFT